ncbi:MAG: hypothetical protein EOO77_22410 [Oxalobacteraceae bacterium]|jgi:hypothetical protein|nr:MAG: hypothetical protein EOO77_22410 [Oxalobacteraceae bacterium]
MIEELLLDQPIGGEPLNLADDTITEETLRAAMRHAFKESLNTFISPAAAGLLADRARVYQKMLLDFAQSGG